MKKNIKASLIYAGISQCGFDSFGQDDESSYIHHGLASISAYAKSQRYGIDLIDLRKLEGWQNFKEEIEKRGSHIYGLTMNSVDYNYVNSCIDIIKRIEPSSKVIVGGIHPTVMLNEVAGNEKVDYIITGEGEISFSLLLSSLKKDNNSPRIIKGISPELDKLPFIDRELFEQKEYPRLSELLPPFVTVIAGRGCKYSCSFCQPAERMLFGNKVRRRSVDNVIEELKLLRKRYNFGSLMVHDDCLTEDVKWIKEFCEKYSKTKFDKPFICQSRADFVCKNKGLVGLMKEAGLYGLIIGFESGSQRILNFLRKGTTVEQNFEASDICRKFGIKIWANYMLGVPTETKREAMATVDMIRKISPDHCSPSYFTPHPGSFLFEYCIENNLSLIHDHENYRRSPRGKKIKGIDYKLLDKSLNMSFDKDVDSLDLLVSLAEKEIEVDSFRDKTNDLQTIVEGLELDRTNLKNHAQNLESERLSLRSHITNLEKEKEQLETHMHVLGLEKEAVIKHCMELEEQKDAFRWQLKDLELDRTNLKNHAQNLEKKKDNICRHSYNLELRNKELEACIKNLQLELDKSQREIELMSKLWTSKVYNKLNQIKLKLFKLKPLMLVVLSVVFFIFILLPIYTIMILIMALGNPVIKRR